MIVVFAAVEFAITGLLSSPLIEETVQEIVEAPTVPTVPVREEVRLTTIGRSPVTPAAEDIWLLTVPCTPLSTTVVLSLVFACPLSDAVGSVNVAVTVAVPPVSYTHLTLPTNPRV